MPGDGGCALSPERPLHFSEKVLPILHSLGIDSYLVVKKYQSMEAMLLYLGRWCTWMGGIPGWVVSTGPDRTWQCDVWWGSGSGRQTFRGWGRMGHFPSSWDPTLDVWTNG